jgi:hypothetical protein
MESTTLAPESDLDKVARLRAKGLTAGRILSALGYPGYGRAYAGLVLANMAEFGLTAHEAVFGGLEADRKIWLHNERKAGRS